MEKDSERQTTQKTDEDPPPAYSSSPAHLYTRIKAAQNESKGKLDCCVKTTTIILGSLWCTIVTGLMLAIPISMIVVGAVYLKDCRYERFIPIYLVVGGCFGTLLNIYRLIHSALGAKKKDGKRGLPIDIIIGLFLFCWFIAGNVWIYRIYKTVNLDDSKSTYFCHRPLYLYAFWITTITWIFFLISVVCGCICGCVCACMGDTEK